MEITIGFFGFFFCLLELRKLVNQNGNELDFCVFERHNDFEIIEITVMLVVHCVTLEICLYLHILFSSSLEKLQLLVSVAYKTFRLCMDWATDN